MKTKLKIEERTGTYRLAVDGAEQIERQRDQGSAQRRPDAGLGRHQAGAVKARGSDVVAADRGRHPLAEAVALFLCGFFCSFLIVGFEVGIVQSACFAPENKKSDHQTV